VTAHADAVSPGPASPGAQPTDHRERAGPEHVDDSSGGASAGVGADAVWPVFAVALLVGGGVRSWQLWGGGILMWQDTTDFLAAAAGSWASADLWAGARPPGAPALLKLVSGEAQAFAAVQAALAIVCWALLAASVATVVGGRWARWVAPAAVLALSCTTPVTMWERSVLSESAAISSLALVVAAGLHVARGVTWGRTVLLAAALVPWLATRDTNAVVALLGGAALLGVAIAEALVRRRGGRSAREAAAAPPGWRGPVVGLGAAGVALGLLVALGAVHGERQAFPMRNVYEVRVLPYPERVRWFAHHGMPQAEAFLGEDGREPHVVPRGPPVIYVPEDDPKLGPWVDWVESDGRGAFARFVATHPGYAFGEPLRTPERAFNNAMGDRDFYAARDQREVPLVDRLFALPTPVVLVVAGAAGGLAVGRRRWTPAFAVGVATAALAVPHGLVAWHSDGMETARHLVVPALQFHLGVLLMAIGALTHPAGAPGQVSSS
jgi:hypothetical protein